ncbi:MAG: 5'-methylthioadenosine/adenosylhomocysteine nucleosidase [Bacteroidaceae bacterium]|nr:5'-methylthioadenosine/adenosylhomocysteine nucleosidase [Bacteroidaceae bacterium]
MKIGIITAMRSEREQIVQLLEGMTEKQMGKFAYVEGRLNGNDLVIMDSGIGKVNSAIGTLELIKTYAPDCIISSGIAGGIDRELSVMDVVVGSRIVYHDVYCGEGNAYGQVQGLPLYYPCNDTLYRCALHLDTDTNIVGGLICSGDKFISDPGTLFNIKEDWPDGLAVDMESGGIAQTCYLYDVPFISFRIISDTPGVDQHMEQYANFWESLASASFAVTKTFLENLPNQL